MGEPLKRPELLVPASSLEVLKIAVIFGADAVYIGGEAFGLRAKAKNFSHEDMFQGIAFAYSISSEGCLGGKRRGKTGPSLPLSPPSLANRHRRRCRSRFLCPVLS